MIRIKVCGMREAENISQIAALKPDYIGFIFFSGSKRFVGNLDNLTVPVGIQKVGVFVNDDPNRILQIAATFELDHVQLHGAETPKTCIFLKSKGLKVIKAFGIDQSYDFRLLDNYNGSCDYFLFDTKTSDYGGSGKKFSWELVEHYNQQTPFFLSGGIDPSDAVRILGIRNPKLYAVDINSRFEQSPGIKDSKMVERFLTEIRSVSKL